MRKLLLLIGGGFLLITACNKSSHENSSLSEEEIAFPTQRSCASNDVLQEQLRDNPSLQQRLDDIETFTRRFIQNPEYNRLLAGGTIEIPVVVNVLYRTNAENISQNQIQSQIDALNKDYGGTNSDLSQTPSIFTSVQAGNVGVTFVLDKVVRKKTSKRSWGTNDAMKKSSKGGIDPTSSTTKLNLWVCNLGGGILGYAQFPGGSSATDGVVVDNNAMGTTGTATAPFNKGRTATHEIGHWMNLRHIWGDATCGNDQVSDTPIATGANFGCPSFPDNSTCGGTTHAMMTMNYMDYSDDACMYMFTAGQKARMLAVFASGGPRHSFAQ